MIVPVPVIDLVSRNSSGGPDIGIAPEPPLFAAKRDVHNYAVFKIRERWQLLISEPRPRQPRMLMVQVPPVSLTESIVCSFNRLSGYVRLECDRIVQNVDLICLILGCDMGKIDREQ